MPRSHRIVAAYPATTEHIRQGLSWLVLQAKRESRTALLVLDTLRVLDTTVGGVLGNISRKTLVAGRPFVHDGVTIVLATSRSMPSNHAGPALVVHPPRKLLNEVDRLRGVSEVLVLPWTESDVADWVAAWRPRPLGDVDGEPDKPPDSLPAEVDAELRKLTDGINLSSGIHHYLDEEKAMRMLERLRPKLESGSLSPDAIRAALVGEHGWSPQHADELRERAQRIVEVRRR